MADNINKSQTVPQTVPQTFDPIALNSALAVQVESTVAAIYADVRRLHGHARIDVRTALAVTKTLLSESMRNVSRQAMGRV